MPAVAPRSLLRLLLVAAAATLAALGAGAPALAHGGEGAMEVTSLTRDGDDVTVTVHLIYVDDGHGVPDATVTVVVDDGTPTPMTAGAEEGDYTATVAATPGATIRVTSVEPPVTVQATAPEASTTTTEGPATSEGGSSSTEATTSEPPTSAAPTTEAPTSTADDSAATDDEVDDGDDDDSTTPVVIGLVALVVVAGGVAAFFVLRKPTPDA